MKYGDLCFRSNSHHLSLPLNLPFQVTVDLDVLVRNDLLRFLKNDTETRGSILLCIYRLLLLFVCLH